MGNTRQQGAIGVGRAVAYYAAKNYAAFTPVSDISRYDLIVDTGDRLLRVEVKTTESKRDEIQLRTMGGNQSWNGLASRLTAKHCDVVFCVNLKTGAEREFSIEELAGRTSVRLR